MIKNNFNYLDQSLSGAKFSIIKKKNKLFFKKFIPFKNISDKNRILCQLSKQNKLSLTSLPDPFFTIKGSGKIEKKNVIIEMPFIHGFSGKEIIINSQKKNIETLIKIFSKLIVFFKNNKLKNDKDKKRNIENKIIELNKIHSNKKYSYVFKFLEKKINDIRNDIDETLCHGDLTFSNVIITKGTGYKIDFDDNRILLIDWLDTYFDSYLQDLAKLKQELFYGWSSRNIYSPQKINNLLTGEYMWENLSKYFINEDNKSLFKIIMILCIMRITPYVKSNQDIIWIDKALNMEINS